MSVGHGRQRRRRGSPRPGKRSGRDCARTKSKLEAVAANSLSETGSNVFAIPADMRSLEGCESFVEAAAERLGGVDILIN
ncbi:MAG: SDR family NAD(P)-dependent oxidoreductase, partial [Alphaproteobacteria bacterium]